jgi:flagellar basal body P-ring protein FlgI
MIMIMVIIITLTAGKQQTASKGDISATKPEHAENDLTGYALTVG